MARLPRDNAQYTNVLSGTYFSSVADHHWQLIAPRFGGILPPYIEYDLHTLLVPGETELIRRRVMNLGLFVCLNLPKHHRAATPFPSNPLKHSLLFLLLYMYEVFFIFQSMLSKHPRRLTWTHT